MKNASIYFSPQATKTVFGQAFQQMKSRDAAIYRLEKGKQVYKTVFVGQFADDYGGPYRSSIVQMCQELQDWVLPLFMPVCALLCSNSCCWASFVRFVLYSGFVD